MNRRLVACAAALLAAGCATIVPPESTGTWPTRRAELQSLGEWSLNGRVAVAAGGEGFSGGLDWQQQGGNAAIELRGPMGGTALRIAIEGGHATVTDQRGRSYDGDEARRVIQDAIGSAVDLPIAEMRYWLVGAPAPGVPHTESLGPDLRLAGLGQAGWQVRYERYESVGRLALPRRVEIENAGLRLRVVVSDWKLPP